MSCYYDSICEHERRQRRDERLRAWRRVRAITLGFAAGLVTAGVMILVWVYLS